ncbi:MAG: PilZ domain-containing protein [Candidatus Desulfofervidaceae bacterium]|nr:PilZ domain-containing protein [Candidatus Desulfofervidaceae bacterium]
MEIEEKRNYLRIDDYLVFEYKILTPEEYVQEKELFFKQSSGVEKIKLKYPFLPLPFFGEKMKEDKTEGSDLEEIFLSLLVGINEKLDNLLQLTGHEQSSKETLLFKKPCWANISGAGIRFYTEQPLPPESFLKIRILLPLFSSFTITTLGQVVRVEKKEKMPYEVAVNFTDIHEDDREALIHYIFVRQRRLIRAEKCEAE